jgi:valyl-tRNA synthetase
MSRELPKAYEPGTIEKKWAEYWVKERLFEVPTPRHKPESAFTLLLPPPNVTGNLHMGHMLNHTEMDIIIRWRRMLGDATIWVPGTDHAGIATQMMVEKQLATEKKNRRDMGREAFIERVWQWRELYGGNILEQMKRLGDSVDWSREYFTMDERLSAAVREVFVRLYEEKDAEGKRLIYRGKYIVNWCPGCMTAISDLEVKHEEIVGKLYEIRYPVIGGNNEFVTIATTRPETMLGDVAIAVNSKDERYRHLHGKKLFLPLAPAPRTDLNGKQIGREIPIIVDELANPEFGTGAVKVTPAHDPNDFQAGLRNDLPQVNVMDESARMNSNAGAYAGLDRFVAREKVLKDLEAQGFLASVKDHGMAVGKCDRSKDVVEPRLSTQWFVAVNRKVPAAGNVSLSDVAKQAVQGDEPAIRFTPENQKTIYLNWMENLYDWCISRQLWWGHRIPAWYCGNANCVHSRDYPGGEPIVALETPAKCPACGGAKLEQESDVLDTWFSSALLPFTVWGWPLKDEKTQKELAYFYPTSLLITGQDILFFWVARMIMMGSWFMRKEPAANGAKRELKDAVPFREVYIHALVRDAERQKMSKTKGNVLDPIEVIEKYGTDATRFTLAAMASPGTDIAFNEARTEGYRAFANKIWNAARFVLMNVDRARDAGWWSQEEWLRVGDSTRTTLEDRWILSRWWRVVGELNSALAEYRFHEAAQVVYDFFWKDFCDWYIELIKPRLNSDSVETQKLALFTVMGVLEGSLRLLHPIMPFITEEIFYAVYEDRPPKNSIALVEFPQFDERYLDPEAEREMELLQELIVAVRTIRAELKVEPKQSVPIKLFSANGARSSIERNRVMLEKLANVSDVSFAPQSLSNHPGSRATAQFEVAVIYERKVDVAAERERLQKELAKMESELAGKDKQLANQAFVGKAPAEVVEGMRKRAAELEVLIQKNRQALKELQ